MNQSIADLHCDLLCYLANDSIRSPYDAEVRCSIPQLQQGGVKMQVLAIYTATSPKSVSQGLMQLFKFHELLEKYPDIFTRYRKEENSKKIAILLSIENASSFFGEEEKLDIGYRRIDFIQENFSKIAYLSMTWNEANRFGGGAHTQMGLTQDGKILLQFLNQLHIPIDLSHTSDALAYDIINEIDKHSLTLPILASHSNVRSVRNVPRNLPDELLSEVIARKGLIGLNFVTDFLGNSIQPHVESIIKLGGEKALCFGADFFYGMDVPPQQRKDPDLLFSPFYKDATVYPKIIEELHKDLQLDERVIYDIAWGNVVSFFYRKMKDLS